MTRILLTTTSFQDTPGPHHQRLRDSGCELVIARGPLPEAEMLKRVGGIDALLCGDDEITRAVIQRALPRLRFISKYGIGVDKIDVEAATAAGIPVAFCPGVNHTTVAEHCFLLLLALSKNLMEQANAARAGQWKRMTGHEILGKTMGVIGLGRIGREVALRARAFGMEVEAFDLHFDQAFAAANGVRRAGSIEEVLASADVVSLHTNLTGETRNMIRRDTLALMKKDALVINCARGELVNSRDMAEALEAGRIAGYGADVLDQEPPPPDHPLLRARNCLVTPHVGSRTHESVQRQAGMAVANLLNMLEGKKPLAQVNSVAVPA
jgi:D-3-phosphoglycerate dehydrogenase